MPEYFTVAEAEALLPRVAPLLADLRTAWEEVVTTGTEVAHLRQRIIGNGHGLLDEMTEIARRFETARQRANTLLTAIRAIGCVVKDPRSGLVDFPARQFGREILLCWKLGERHITWWHEVDEGFVGRQPLDAE